MKTANGRITLLFFVFLFGLLSGCASLTERLHQETTRDSNASVQSSGSDVHQGAFTKTADYHYRENPYEGSLWTPLNSRAHLFIDTKARNINDIVTVKIMESSDASRNASTKVSRKGGLKSSIKKFFGSPLDFGMQNIWGKDKKFSPEIETDSDNSFDGSGTTKRKDTLIATLSARVVDVFPNGNLAIKGEREVTINNEKQFIILNGIIRPEDISSNNTIISTAIADAKIVLSGKGVIADKQYPGWGHRIFDWIWPF